MKKNVLLPLVGGLFLMVALVSACGAGNTTSSSSNSASLTQQPTHTVPVQKTQPASLKATVTNAQPSTGSSNTPLANLKATVTNTQPSSTPTNGQGSCNVTYGCGVGSSNLTPYKGNGYTINFPGSWVVQSDGSNGNIFSTPDGSASFHVFVQDSSTLTNPLRYEFGTLSAQNCHAVPAGLAVTQSNSGVTWGQSQYVCDAANTGGQQKEIGVLTATNAYNNKYYSIDFITSPTNYNTSDQTFFRPMVASFKLQ